MFLYDILNSVVRIVDFGFLLKTQKYYTTVVLL